MGDLSGKKIVIVSGDYFEESELTEPLEGLREMGATVTVAGAHDGELQAMHGDVEQTVTVPVDITIEELDADDYDAVVLPGGVVNADHLRTNPDAQAFVRAMASAGKPVAAICHAPWLLVSAGLAQGQTLTSYPSLRDDIANAGGIWVDEEVAVSSPFITSRTPDDLPAFIDAINQALTGE